MATKNDESVEDLAASVPLPHAAVTPLTTPTTLLGLRNWLKGVDALVCADSSAVTATASSISIA